MSPKVTIIVITYNHAPYIGEALEGVLAQQTSFETEIIVTEDCSTDDTLSIVDGYRQRSNGSIRIISSPKNRNDNFVFERALNVARGEYIAVLDGDDIWTANFKLERQADFLDREPASALNFHNVEVCYEDGRPSHPFVQWHMASESTFADMILSNFIPTCSVMVRRSALYPLPAWYRRAAMGDWPLWILAARTGRISYTDEVMGVWRIHPRGVWNSMTEPQQFKATLRCYGQLERGLEPGRRREIHQARAAYRRKYLSYLGSRDRRGAELAQTLIGLWRDRLAYTRGELRSNFALALRNGLKRENYGNRG
jgi:glycosyltransferase involved in cell wall biosynthesis